MATPVLFLLFLCLLFCVLVSSKPVAQDSEPEQIKESDNSVLKWTPKLDSVPEVKSSVRDLKLVEVLNSGILASKNAVLRRVRRNTINGNGCPGEMILLMHRCWTFEEWVFIIYLFLSTSISKKRAEAYFTWNTH